MERGRLQASGFELQFDTLGSVVSTWFYLVSPTVVIEDLDYSFYWLTPTRGESQYLLLPSETMFLDADMYMTSIKILSKEHNPLMSIGKPVAPSFSFPECVSFLSFADAYDASMIRKIIQDYITDSPLRYVLTSKHMALSDLEKPGVSIRYLDCSGGNYRELNPFEIAALTDIPETTDSDFLYFNEYWYITLLPYYSDGIPYNLSSGEQAGILPIREYNHLPDAEMFSANNVLVLLFPLSDGER